MRYLLVVIGGLILFAGCEAEVVHVPPRVGTPALPSSPPHVSPPTMVRKAADVKFDPEKMDVKVGDDKALDALIAKHKGEIVFVDYWATWCEPCVEFFPHTVDTFEKYRGQGLTAIAVSFDPTDEEVKVRRFLAEHRAGFENLICSYEAGPEAFEKFGIDLVPHFRLYDRHGKLRAKWDSAPKDLDAKVQELLAEK